jgi:hypothetical protein
LHRAADDNGGRLADGVRPPQALSSLRGHRCAFGSGRIVALGSADGCAQIALCLRGKRGSDRSPSRATSLS